MKLSIVIPSYNCYESTLRIVKDLEPLKDTEIIVVNDASPEPYGKFPSYVKYIKLKKNSKAVVARYEGWKVSKGEYVYFFDADDIINYKVIEQALPKFKKDHDLFVFNMEKEFKNGKKKIMPHKITKDVSSLGYASYYGDKIFRSSLITTDMFDFKSEIFQDENFVMRYSVVVRRIQFFFDLDPISTYLYNDGSVSKQKPTYKHISKLTNNIKLLIPFVENEIDNKELQKNFKKQMGRMATIAVGWSLASTREVSTKVLKDIKELCKSTDVIKPPLNYAIAYQLIKFVKFIKVK